MSSSNPSSNPDTSGQSAAFAADPRVHFNKASNKWEYEDEQGNEFEWNQLVNNWVPIVRLLAPWTAHPYR